MTGSNDVVPDSGSLEQSSDLGDHAVREQPLHSGAFPDIILKSQFFELIGRRSLTSEQRLMVAVLADAINIVRGGCRSVNEYKGTAFAEAKDWIFEPNCHCPMAFEHVCDALGIEAVTLRGRISAMLSGASEAPQRLRLKEGSRRVTLGTRRRNHRGAPGTAAPDSTTAPGARPRGDLA